jgi:hypothetical protein
MSRPRDHADSQKPDWLKAAEANGLIGKTTTVNVKALVAEALDEAGPDAVAEAGRCIVTRPAIVAMLDGTDDEVVAVLSGLTEEMLQHAFVEYARYHGWKAAHCRRARVRIGGVETWRTPMGADGNGWPDLVLCHPVMGIMVVAEVKTETGVRSVEQEQWADWLIACGVAYRLWKPSDWPLVRRELGGK